MHTAYDQPRANDIVFIFNNVKDYAQLAAAVPDGSEVHVLDSTKDGLAQMAAIVDGRSDIGALHIVSHGGAGVLNLGALTLDKANLGDHANVLAKIGGALAADGDILLYGCDVAAGAGNGFVDQLAQLTGADVAASTNATGSAALGGDWVLEYSRGQVADTHALDVAAVRGLDTLLALPSAGTVNIADTDTTTGTNSSRDIGGNWFSMFSTAQLTTDPDPVDGVYMIAGTPDESITITAKGFSSFDLTGMNWVKYFDGVTYDGAYTFNITGYKFDGSASVTTSFSTVDTSSVYTTGNYSQFTNLSGFKIQILTTSAGDKPSANTFDYFTIANPDNVPAFVSSTTTISLNQNGSAYSLNSLLHVSDGDSGQTLTWSQQAGPTHGTLGIAGATASAGSTDITPGGSLTYTPNSGYAGTDTFTVQVSDGFLTIARTFTVSVTPSAPSAPNLTAAGDTGSSSTDNITKATALTFSGTGTAGDSTSTVRVFIDKNGNNTYDAGTDPTGTATMSNGAWTVSNIDASGVSDGSYNVYAVSTSGSGGLSSGNSSALSITVDRAVPGAPSVPALSAASDSGTSSSDRVTKTTTPTFTGTAEANSTVTLYDGATQIGTATADGSGNWSITSSTLSSGSHSIGATATDAAGNTGSQSSQQSITIDTTAPTLNITSSKSTLKVGDTATITFSFSEDPGTTFTWDGTSGDVVVSGGTLGAISGTGNTRTATFTPTANTDGGTASITVAGGSYTDAAGNNGGAGTSPGVTFDTKAPTVSVASSKTAMALGDTATITFTFSEDPGSSFAWNGTTGDVTVSGGTLSAISGTGTTRTATFTAGAGATASVAVIAGSYTDAAGNTGASGTSPTISLDTTPPNAPSTPALTSADTGISSSDYIIKSATPTFGGTAEADSTVKLYDSATLVGTGTADGSGNWSITTSALADGSHHVTATATDAAANVSPASSALDLTTDTTAPTLAITSDKASLKVGETATITFTFSEDPDASFSWDGSVGDVSVTGGTLSAISGTGSVRTAVFTPSANTNGGNATISVASAAYTDIAGNNGGAGSKSLSFDTLAPAAPSTPALDSLSDSGTANDNLTKTQTPQLDGTAEAGATVRLYDGAALVGSGTANGSGNWTITTSTLAEGSHTLTATATDAAGNTGPASSGLTLDIDTTAPTLAITSDKPTLKAGETATITFSFSEDPGASFSWNGTSGDVSVSGGTLSAISGFGSTRTATFTPSANTNAGTASITVAGATYTDAAGNDGGAGATPSVHFDTLAPTVTITSDKAAIKIGETATITFTFSEDPDTSFTWDGSSGDVTVSGGTLSAISGTGTTRTAVFTPTAGTNGGNATISIAAGAYVDAAGNDGTSGSKSLTFDTLAPAAPSAPVLDSGSDSGTANDNRTNDTTPQLNGTAEAGATVKVYDGATQLGSGTADGSGNWSITISALAQGSHTITATATDAAGNTGTASNALALDIDTTAPTLAITSDTATLKAGETATVTFTFSEDPGSSFSWDGTSGDVVVSGGTLSAISGSGNTRTATFTPTANVNSGTPSITVAGSTYTDAAGNNGGAGTSPSIHYDTLAPTVAITSSTSSLKIGETAAITFTFSEDPGTTFAWDGTSGDVTVSGGTLSALSGTGAVRTAVFTPATGTNGGTASITIAAASYADAAGNDGGAGATPSLHFDTLAPSSPSAPALDSGSDSGIANDSVTKITTPQLNGTAEAGATVRLYDGATLVGSSSADGSGNWSITASTLAEGSHTLTATATDAAGNTGAASGALTLNIDTTAPTLAITSDKAALKGGETATVTFTFSEDPGTTFAWNGSSGDISVSGGTLSAISGSGNTRTATFTPSTDTNAGTASITVAGSTYTDAAGNNGGAGTTPSVHFDTLAPTVAITTSTPALKIGETATITFTFSEDPGTSFSWDGTSGDVAVSGGTLSAISGTGTVRTAVFTPDANTQGGVASITVTDASYTDPAGNAGHAGTTPGLGFDTLAPLTPSAPVLDSGSDSGTSHADNLTKNTTLLLNGTTEADSTVKLYDGASLVGTGTADGAGNWSVTTSVLAAGSHSLTVASTDVAGNTGPASAALAVTIDTTAPTLAITSDKAALKGGETATITFTFSEDPGTTFSWDGSSGDVSVSGGTISAISGSGNTRTATFTPNTDTNAGTASITVAGSTYTDAAGNNGGAGATPSVHFDTLAPTVAITSSTPALKMGETATITFTFSEDPGTSFSWDGTSGDVAVSGGTLSATSGTGAVRTAVFTPIASTDGGVASITIASATYADAAGNDGAPGITPSLHFDTLAPAAPSAPVLDSGSDTGTSHADNLTTDTTLQLNGTAEAGSSVKLYDGATLVATGTADNAGNWSVTTSALAAGTHALTATATDGAGNTGAASSPLSVTVDTTAPTLAISSDKAALKIGETATITFTFSEDPGITFGWDGASGDVSVSGGTLSAISGSGNVRTSTFTPTASTNAGTASITVAGGAYNDAAGNDGGAGATPSIHFDTLAPTVAITSDKAALKIGETATITFTFSEDPGTSFSWDGTSGDVTVSGGTLSAISGSGTVRTATFTPTAGTNGGVGSITVADTSFADAAGNGGLAGTTPSLVFDTQAPAAPSAPALAAASDSGASHNDGLTNAASLTFTGTAEAGSTVSVIDDTTKAVLGTGVATGGNWSIAVSSAAQPEGAFHVAAIATDAAGNVGVQSAATTVMLDRVAPTALSVSLDVDSGVVGDNITNIGRVKVQGFEMGATWEYSLDSGAHWQPGSAATFLVPNPGLWTVTARQSDAAGNASASAAPLTFTLLGDEVRPTSTISLSDTSLTNGETALVTIVFNARVTGFTLDDITAPNGTLSGLATSDAGRTWTVTFTPQPGVTAETNSIIVNNAGVADLSGNAGSGTSTSPVYSVFTAGVSAAITLSDTSLLAGETSVVTIVFSEAVNGFALSKLDAPNGKLSGLQSSDGRTFTALFTPSVNISDTTNVITFDNSSVVGAHGSQGSGTSRSANYVVETVRPTAMVSVADHLIAQGGKTTLTVKFSQPVAGFDSADLDISHASIANLSSADGGLTWTAALTADSGSKAATPGRVTLHLDGVHNAVGNAGAGLADAQFVITSANAKSTAVDGVQVVTDSFTNTSGHQEQVTAVPLVQAGRVDDAATAHGTLADIPLVPATAPGNAPVLSASLPVGAGLLVQGPAAPLPAADALTDLIARISDKTGPDSSTQSEMVGSGQSFVAALGAGATIASSTVVPTVAPGSTLSQPIIISGATPTPGTSASTLVGLVIDATGLPSGSTLQLDNVDFAAVTGNVRLFGGLGQNYVVGDAGSQTIYLGPDDDILSGGGGNDFIGSAGGNDTLDGGDGDDLVVGGIGNDRVSGGSGDDMVNGGRSTVGSWNFFVSATGAVTARHDGAVFTISGSEAVQGAELNASVAELGFLKADPQKVAGIALLYAGLDRTPDLAGLSFWATSGASLGDVAKGVLASSEFGGGPLGQIDNASFVRGMYQHVLGRAAEDAAVGYWTARLSGSDGRAAASRADVLVAVALSDEHKAAALGATGYTVAQASVKQETAWFSASGDDRLSGGPGNDLLVGGDGVDTAVYDGKASQYRITLGSDNAIHVVDTANGDVDTLSGIEKAEFKDGTLDLAFTAANPAQLARIGMLYQAVLDRPVDAAGLNWWVSTGIDTTQLAQAITGTAEFQSHYGGMSNAAFVQALYANSGLAASSAGGEQSWEAYLGSHTRAQLIANWITQDDVVHAQFGASGLWLV
jgi:large repetitive protein